MSPPPFSPRVEIDNHMYFPEPYSLEHIPDPLWRGMIPVAVLATLSVGTSLTLAGFMTWRFISWKLHYKTFVGYNQYIVLVLNLLIADVQQSAAFLISFHWIRVRKIVAPSAPCFAQGWLLHSGDLSSGLFVLAIGLHTMYTAVYGGRMGHKIFSGAIIGTWVFAYLMTSIGLGMHGETYFTRAGAWCWVSEAYEENRLAFHYIWVFIVQFGTILIYIWTFVKLRMKTQSLWKWHKNGRDVPNLATVEAVNRITRLMTLYPCVYVVLTLPLSAGRMWSMAHNGRPYSDEYACIAGALLTSCGWVDTLLYTLTRRKLLQDTMPEAPARSRERVGNNDFEFLDPKGITHTRTVTVEGSTRLDELDRRGHHAAISSKRDGGTRTPSPTGSVEPILHSQMSGHEKKLGMSAGLQEIMAEGDEESDEKDDQVGALRPGRSRRRKDGGV